MKILWLAALVAVTGCSREDLYAQSSFTDNVSEAYADCSESEIRFLAGKHNIQTAFRNCGSNNFIDTAWAPDGEKIHFRVTNGSYLLHAEDKTIAPIPTEVPVSDSAWLHADLLAMPLIPAIDGVQMRMALYNLSANTLNIVGLPATSVLDLQPWGDGQQLLLLATTAQDPVQRPYRFDPSTSELVRVFEFITAPVKRLVYTPEAELLAWSSPEATELMRPDGTSLQILPGVLRAVPHPEGRYVVLEQLGEPISLFDQRTWNELSPEARERELARQQKFVESLPDWAPREYTPPELHILDLQEGTRHRISAFYGDHFEWYRSSNPMARYYISFMLWGIEGKQLNRNVALSDMSERLRMIGKGELPIGIEQVGGVSSPTPAAGDASGEIQEEAGG
ncbi:MAG: hypothetical protein ACI8S6_005875 [Myxococcota bacterium]|jgi:hypothetical protein